MNQVSEIDVAVGIGAKRPAVAGRHDGVWRIRLSARPVDGQANAELIRFMAKTLGITRSGVRIIRGLSSRRKRLDIDVDTQTIDAALRAIAPDHSNEAQDQA